MAFSEFELKKYERIVHAFVERRRPAPPIRPKLDLGFRITGQSVELFQIRPRWNEPELKVEQAVAKATFVKSSDTWKVFWQRADLKWHAYEPSSEVESLDDFLALVDRDEHACFFG